MAYHVAVETILADWFRDATYGINAQIAALSGAGLLVSGHQAPPTFDTGAIATEFEDGNVADGDFPASKDPALAISQTQQTQFPGEVFTTSGTRTGEQFPVLLRYFRDAQTNGQQLAARDWSYTARAILRSLRVLTQQPHLTSRQLAGVGIVSFDSYILLEPFQTRNSAHVTGGLGLLLTVRDLVP